MTPGYGKSFTVWCSPTPGTTRWPFVFVDGYIDRTFVKARFLGFDDVWYPVYIDYAVAFLSDGEIEITTPPVPPCKIMEIYRDTPKDAPIVDYGFGGGVLSDKTRSAAVRQALHVVVELKERANRSDLPCLCDCMEG